MKKLALLLTTLFFTSSVLAISPSDLQSVPLQTQLLNNGGFENSTAKWVKSIGTFTSQPGTKFNGKAAGSWALASQAGTLSQDVTSPGSFQAEASCMVKTTTPGFQLCSRSAGVAGTCSSVPSDGNWNYVSASFLAPSSGTMGVQVSAAAATTGTVYVDSCYLGRSASSGTQVSQAQFFGSLTATCSSSNWSTSSNTFTPFTAITGCTYVASGNAIAPSTQIPAISFSSMPPGNYLFVYEGRMGSNTAGTVAQYRFTDGTNTAPETTGLGSSNSQTISSTFSANYTYAAGQGATTWQIISRVDPGGTSLLLSSESATIKVYYFPSQAQTAVGVAQTLSVLGTDFYTPAATCPTGSVKEDGTAYVLSAHPELTALANALPSSYTVAGVLTVPNKLGIYTSGAGSQSLGGIVYTNTLGSYSNDQFQGHDHTLSAVVNGQANTGVYTAGGSGTYNSYHTLGTVTDGTNGSPRVGTTTYPANFAETPCISYASQPAPVLVGSVTSAASGAMRIEGARITNGTGATCAITASTSSWIFAASRNATGNCTYTLSGFSAAPFCTITSLGSGGNIAYLSGLSSTSLTVQSLANASAADDSDSIVCIGSR